MVRKSNKDEAMNNLSTRSRERHPPTLLYSHESLTSEATGEIAKRLPVVGLFGVDMIFGLIERVTLQ